MDTTAFLIVQSGPKLQEGKIIPLSHGTMLVGRAWLGQKPDITFDDLRISRRHAEVSYDSGHFFLQDLPTSRHGTELNGSFLTKGKPHVLQHNDEISLARGAVVLRFCYQTEELQTHDLSDFICNEKVITEKGRLGPQHLLVDETRREVLIDGKELAPRLPSREFELILLLYRNRGKAVTHKDIIDWVWRDIAHRDTITNQDINTLVYRLKKYIRECEAHIVNIPSYGYRLE